MWHRIGVGEQGGSGEEGGGAARPRSLHQDFWECRLHPNDIRVKNGKMHHSMLRTGLCSLDDVAIFILHNWLLWDITLSTSINLEENYKEDEEDDDDEKDNNEQDG